MLFAIRVLLCRKDYDYKLAFDWNQQFLDIERYAAGYRPGPAPRALAYMGLSAYEACITGMPNYRSMAILYAGLTIPAVEVGAEYHWPTVVNASYTTLMPLFFGSATSAQLQAIATLSETNNTKFKTTVIKDKKEGSMIDFYPDGKKKSDRFFKNDIQIGKTAIYHPNGNIKEVQYYDNTGQREKGDTLWYENGSIEYIAQFSKHMKNGLITKFDSSQQTIYRAVFKNDTLVQVL